MLTAELKKATELFKKIAEQPVSDDNRVLGQVLYGLALRCDSLKLNLPKDMVGDVKQT